MDVPATPQKIQLWIGLALGLHRRQGGWPECIVIVEENDELADCGTATEIARCTDPAVLRILQRTKLFRIECRKELLSLVGRAIIDDQHFVISECLLGNAPESAAQHLHTIVCRHNNAENWNRRGH